MTTSLTYFIISFFIGLVLVAPYLWWLNRLSLNRLNQAAGVGLIVAAIIYIGFAWFNGNEPWLLVEALGVLLYGLSAWLAWRFSILWLAAGWGLHPLWDVWVHWLGLGSHIAPAWYAIACLSFDFAVAIYIVKRSGLRPLLHHESNGGNN